MKNFLKYTFATVVGSISTFFVVVLIVFITIGISSSSEEVIQVKENTVLKVKLSSGMIDREPLNPLAKFGFLGSGDSDIIGLNKILAAISAAKEDDNIKGIYLDGASIGSGGLATLEALRTALVDFQSSGKFIYAYSEYYTQRSYYIASVSNKIFVNPAGAV